MSAKNKDYNISNWVIFCIIGITGATLISTTTDKYVIEKTIGVIAATFLCSGTSSSLGAAMCMDRNKIRETIELTVMAIGAILVFVALGIHSFNAL